MKKISIYVFLFALIFNVCGCSQTTTTTPTSLGSANTPEGTTVVVSVFANDPTYSWDFSTKEDQDTKENILKYMKIATNYLVDVTESYGMDSNYIYDFEANTDLYYETTFDLDVAQEDATNAEDCMNSYLDENVDSESIKEKYNADNIIYFMIVNTDEKNEAITCTRNYYEGMEYPYEIVFLYNIDSGLVNCPAVYAHEMLHTFGAPDLYYKDETYGFTDEFLSYVQSDMDNDLMYTCTNLTTEEYDYTKITNEVSELDAYYAGLTNQCDLVDQFHLNKSQHQ